MACRFGAPDLKEFGINNPELLNKLDEQKCTALHRAVANKYSVACADQLLQCPQLRILKNSLVCKHDE